MRHRRRRTSTPPPMSAARLNALALVAEQIAGTSYDLAMEGRARDEVVQAAIAATARLAESEQAP